MKKILILATLILAACTTPISQEDKATPPVETPTATATATRTPISPTSTPVYINTTVPSPTSTQALSEEGPYLVYRQVCSWDTNDDCEDIWMMVDADSIGKRKIDLLSGAYAHRDMFSPDGAWVAFFQGAYMETPYDLTLYVMNISNGEIHEIMSLLSDFQEGWSTEYKEILQYGIDSFQWGPDSNKFIFTAQLDGVSSDIFLFDLLNFTMERLTDDAKNISSINRSPDGNYILFETGLPEEDFDYYVISMADADITQIDPIADSRAEVWQWVSDTEVMLYHIKEPDEYNEGGFLNWLGILNIETLTVTSLWGSYVEDFSVDVNTRLLFVRSGAPSFIVDFDGHRTSCSDEVDFWHTSTIGNKKYAFIGFAFEAYLIGKDCSLTLLPGITDNYAIASPDGSWYLIPSAAGYGFSIYSGLDMVYKDNSKSVEGITWRPDSQGAFIFSRSILYYLNILDGELVLVDVCGAYCSSGDARWLYP